MRSSPDSLPQASEGVPGFLLDAVLPETIYWPIKLDTACVALAKTLLLDDVPDIAAMAETHLSNAQIERMAGAADNSHDIFEIEWLAPLTPEQLKMLWQDYKRLALWCLIDAWNVVAPGQLLPVGRLRVVHQPDAVLQVAAGALETAMFHPEARSKLIRVREMLLLADEALHCPEAQEQAIKYKDWLKKRPRGGLFDAMYTRDLITWAESLYDAAIRYLANHDMRQADPELVAVTIQFLLVRRNILQGNGS